MTLTSYHTHCTHLVKQYDYARYFCSLFGTNTQQRQHIHALYAFNHEIAKIKEITNEPMVGLIRLQWWQEALTSMQEGTPRNHPVILALYDYYQQHPTSLSHLSTLVTAREDDLELHPFATETAWDNYARAAIAPLWIQLLDIMQIECTSLRNAVPHLAIAWNIVGHMRSLYHHWQHQHICFPASYINEYKLSAESLIQTAIDPAILQSLIHRATQHATKHMEQACTSIASSAYQKQAAPLTLLTIFLDKYITTLHAYNYDPKHIQQNIPLFGTQLKCVWRYAYKGSIVI